MGVHGIDKVNMSHSSPRQSPQKPRVQRLSVLEKQNHDIQSKLQKLTDNIDSLDGSKTKISLDNFERISSAFESLSVKSNICKRSKSHEDVASNESHAHAHGSSAAPMVFLELPTDESAPDEQSSAGLNHKPRRHSISEGDLPRRFRKSRAVLPSLKDIKRTDIEPSIKDSDFPHASGRTREIPADDQKTQVEVTITDLSNLTPTDSAATNDTELGLLPPITRSRRHSIDVGADLERRHLRSSAHDLFGSFERLETIGEATMAKVRPRHDFFHTKGIPMHLYPEFFHIYWHDSPTGTVRHHAADVASHVTGPRQRSRSLGAVDLIPRRRKSAEQHDYTPSIPEYRALSSLRPSDATPQPGDHGLASWCGLSKKRLERVQELRDSGGRGKCVSENRHKNNH